MGDLVNCEILILRLVGIPHYNWWLWFWFWFSGLEAYLWILTFLQLRCSQKRSSLPIWALVTFRVDKCREWTARFFQRTCVMSADEYGCIGPTLWVRSLCNPLPDTGRHIWKAGDSSFKRSCLAKSRSGRLFDWWRELRIYCVTIKLNSFSHLCRQRYLLHLCETFWFFSVEFDSHFSWDIGAGLLQQPHTLSLA